MAKTFKIYSIIWAISFITFNVITFISPIRMNATKGSFWINYIFIIVTFLGQLFCAYIAFKEKNLKKVFYNISLTLISYIFIFLIVSIGMVCMINPVFPMWMITIMCVILTSIFACVIVTICFTVNVISNNDDEIQTNTYTIKKLTTNAEHLVSVVQKEELKIICKKVYEALQYSDPMNNIVLSEISQQIQNEFEQFEMAVNNNDIEMAQNVSNELLNLIDKRNKKSALLK